MKRYYSYIIVSLFIAFGLFVCCKLPKSSYLETTTHNGVIVDINPPKHVYITVDFGDRREKIWVSKHFFGWENYIWVGKKVTLTKRRKLITYPRYSLFNFSENERIEERFEWENVKESIKK